MLALRNYLQQPFLIKSFFSDYFKHHILVLKSVKLVSRLTIHRMASSLLADLNTWS